MTKVPVTDDYNGAFVGTATYYSRYRTPYPQALLDDVAAVLHLDGTRTLMDIGAGTGELAVSFARQFERVVAIEPDAGMLAEAKRRARAARCGNIEWVRGTASHLPSIDARPRLVTFGRSFHWTNRQVLLSVLAQLLEPAGGIAIIDEAPVDPSDPMSIGALTRDPILRWIGACRRAGARGTRPQGPRHEAVIRESGFRILDAVTRRTERLYTPEDIVGYLRSTSFASRAVVGKRWRAFEDDVRHTISRATPGGVVERVVWTALLLRRK